MKGPWKVEPSDNNDFWLLDGEECAHARGKSRNALNRLAGMLNEYDGLRATLFAIGVPNNKLENYERELPTCSKEHLISIILKDMKQARNAWGEWGGVLPPIHTHTRDYPCTCPSGGIPLSTPQVTSAEDK